MLSPCSVHAGDCLFRFQQQPSTSLSCNPYQETPTATTLHVTCLARGPLQVALQVEWWLSEQSETHSTNISTLARVNTEDSDYRVIETKTTNGQQLISTTLSVTVDTEKKRSLCVWCQLEAPGRTLVGAASNQLCIRKPQTYSDSRGCNSQEVVDHDFSTVCIEEQRVVRGLSSTSVYSGDNTPLESVTPALSLLQSQELVDITAASPVLHRESLGSESILGTMSTSPHLRILGSGSSTPFTSHHMYAPSHSVYIGSSSTSRQKHSMTTSVTTHLLPTPTMGPRHDSPDSMLGSNSLIALYTAAVVCVLLATVIVILVMAVMVLFRRHNRLKRQTKSGLRSSPPNKVGQNLSQNRSQFSSLGQFVYIIKLTVTVRAKLATI